MGIEYAVTLGYAAFSMILITTSYLFWDKEERELKPLCVLLLLLGIFLAVKIPSTLNHFVYSNDYVNEGLLNSTQVADVVRSNNLYAKWGTRAIYFICAYFAIWFSAFWLWRKAGGVYKEGIAEIGKGENAGFGKNRGKGGKWQNPKWK